MSDLPYPWTNSGTVGKNLLNGESPCPDPSQVGKCTYIFPKITVFGGERKSQLGAEVRKKGQGGGPSRDPENQGARGIRLTCLPLQHIKPTNEASFCIIVNDQESNSLKRHWNVWRKEFESLREGALDSYELSSSPAVPQTSCMDLLPNLLKLCQPHL